MKNLIARLVSEEDGATMVEYALMVAVIAIAVMTVAATLGSNIKDAFQSAADKISGTSAG